MKRPIIIGIAGGIASGKSLVSRMLQQQGAVVIHADQIAQQVLDIPEVQMQLTEVFGRDILNEVTQSLDRKKIAERVFGDSEQAISRRRKLEGITHPRIRARIHEELSQAKGREGLNWIVLDIPLLFESGWNLECDSVWFVDTPEEDRVARAKQRGWREEEFRAREAAQWSIERKRAASDRVIENRGTEQALAIAVSEASALARKAK